MRVNLRVLRVALVAAAVCLLTGVAYATILWFPDGGSMQNPAPAGTYTGYVWYTVASPNYYTIGQSASPAGQLRIMENDASLSQAELDALARATWEGDSNNSVVISAPYPAIREVDSVSTGTAGVYTGYVDACVSDSLGESFYWIHNGSGTIYLVLRASDPSLSAGQIQLLDQAETQADNNNSVTINADGAVTAVADH